ncbi:MAG: hypothetical protein RLZZ623_812, partial [Actinomycetota bacterium]
DSPAVYKESKAKESKAKESFTRAHSARLLAVLTSPADDAPRTATPSAYFIAVLTRERKARRDRPALLG